MSCGFRHVTVVLPSRVHRDLEARSHEDSARRVAIWHQTATIADEILRGDDMRPHYDDHERLSRLFAAIGDVTTDILDNASLDLDAALVRLVAEGQLWLEARAREIAAQ
jgi:hypothetical protein